MLTIFKHHISMWSLLEMVADFMLCFLAVMLAADRLPLSFDMRPQHHLSSVVLSAAVAFSVFMALLYSFVGLYRQGEANRVGLPILFGRAFMAMAMGSCIAYVALETMVDGRYAYLLLLYAVPFMALGIVAVRGVGYLGRRSAFGARRVLIVGTGPEARNADTAASASTMPPSSLNTPSAPGVMANGGNRRLAAASSSRSWRMPAAAMTATLRWNAGLPGRAKWSVPQFQ